MKMSRDELEYAISQYIDGTLAPIERPAVEERLATDPEARAILAEYRRFDSVLKTSMPVPELAWDEVHAQISQACAAEEAPVRHFSIRSIKIVRTMAIAAALLLVASVTLKLIQTDGRISQPAGRMVIEVLQHPSAEGGRVAQAIDIGPSPQYAQMNASCAAEEEIVARPTIVMIERAASSGQDSDSTY
jgi:anti-sigma factor RsiW